MSTKWHRFAPTSDDDNECTNHGCGVIVTDEAVSVVSIGCPVPLCDDPSNDGYPCVVVPGDRHPECSYCGRPAVTDPDTDHDDDGDDLDDDEDFPDLA